MLDIRTRAGWSRILLARWENEFDLARARAVLADRENYDNPTVPAAAVAGAETMVSAARAA